MAIEITEFANVSISVSPVGVSAGNFGILGFLTDETDDVKTGSEILPAERTRAYSSIAGVGADWDADSEVYKAATAFYSQTPTPTDFVAMVCYETAQAPSIVGGSIATLDYLVNTYTGLGSGAGELVFTVDSTEVTMSEAELDFSSAISYGEVATVLEGLLQASIPSTSFTHNGYQFVIVGNTSGASSTAVAATGDVAAHTDLGLAGHQAKVSNGVDAETPAQALSVIESEGHDFVGLVTNKKWRDDSGTVTTDIAAFAEASKKIFCNTTNDTSVLTSGHTGIAKQLKDLTYRYSLTTFSRDQSAYPSASVFGRAASVNFSSIGSTITLNLKQMPGVSAENLTSNEFDNMRANFCSAVVQIGKTVNAFTDSRMASGSWLDTTHGLMWLEARCEADMFNLLYVNNTKIPYTQVGINTAVAVLERSLSAAIRNGLAAPGYLPDGTYLPEGFIVESVSLADTPAGDKGNRIYNGLSFKMVGAGALHEVSVSGQFSE